ncbi:hypothetical protein [Paenibacillus caui]|nr:hypothetical protein [Paenibacillus caui]
MIEWPSELLCRSDHQDSVGKAGLPAVITGAVPEIVNRLRTV